MNRHVVDVNGLRQRVTGGARYGGDDGRVLARQRIEQGAFAHIGLAHNDQLQSLAQQNALARSLMQFFSGLHQLLQLPQRIGLLQEVNFFFGKIQRGLDQHAQTDEGLRQCMDFIGKGTGHGAGGASRCRLGAGIDQVSHRFGLGQVQFVVEISALGELTRPRQPHACHGVRC